MKKLIFSLFMVAIFEGCSKDDNNTTPSTAADIVYIESNNSGNNANSILAYRHKDDGTLTLLGTYATGGAGVQNPTEKLGPDDSETQLKISADNKFLLAVNAGSNTIAVFTIQSDGTLVTVSGSPFPSGGETPSSIDMQGQYVYIVNKSDDPLHPSTMPPNYTVFTMNASGALTPVPASTIATTPMVSPTQVLVSNDGKFAFGDEFLGFMATPPKGTLRSFAINSSTGLLTAVDSPYHIPDMGGALGLWQHPSQNVLYVGFPLAGKVAAYSIDATTGVLTFGTSVNAGLAACWLRTAQGGNRLYALNSGENTISMYNTSSALAPTALGAGKLTLKKSGPNYTIPVMGTPVTFTTSEPFSFEFSSNEKFLYVVNQHTNADFSVGNYNYFHVLAVADDGTLTEPTDPTQLPVDNVYRPQGSAVFRIN